MRFFKLLFVIVTTLYVGTVMFLHGFSAWRDGETVVRHRGETPFTAMADGPFPITFATEVWGFMILGAAVALAGVAGIVRLIFIAPARRQEALARMDDFTLRDRRGEKIPVWAAMAIIGGVVAFSLYCVQGSDGVGGVNGGRRPERSLTCPCKFTSENNVVFLAITPNGLKDALREAASSGTSVWCGAGAVSEEDFDALKVPGLTRFDYSLEERDPLVLADALDTIDQHHPGEVVWVEAAASGR